ncbi:uncharacterized protein BJ171DRAFT_11697 [Polychytrium aggregatum]|uniref:uncharacterized protein n=1 Tax=Polychytrium aggregatum TaxID=110093 RepID=UPI0022FE1BEC|nr:uncharacterized protein BJ171DRAFT_11697 [Polychytrium aggregatum]KAI9206562.1 hypothetical protein BJ171DRAFT_11697 [Polychytrium aggregatum]
MGTRTGSSGTTRKASRGGLARAKERRQAGPLPPRDVNARRRPPKINRRDDNTVLRLVNQSLPAHSSPSALVQSPVLLQGICAVAMSDGVVAWRARDPRWKRVVALAHYMTVIPLHILARRWVWAGWERCILPGCSHSTLEAGQREGRAGNRRKPPCRGCTHLLPILFQPAHKRRRFTSESLTSFQPHTMFIERASLPSLFRVHSMNASVGPKSFPARNIFYFLGNFCFSSPMPQPPPKRASHSIFTSKSLPSEFRGGILSMFSV